MLPGPAPPPEPSLHTHVVHVLEERAEAPARPGVEPEPPRPASLRRCTEQHAEMTRSSQSHARTYLNVPGDRRNAHLVGTQISRIRACKTRSSRKRIMLMPRPPPPSARLSTDTGRLNASTSSTPDTPGHDTAGLGNTTRIDLVANDRSPKTRDLVTDTTGVLGLLQTGVLRIAKPYPG